MAESTGLRIREVIVIGLVESTCGESIPLAEWTGELAELVAIDDDEEE